MNIKIIMKKAIGIIICFLAILLFAPRAGAKEANKALLFPVEYTTNNPSKIWDNSNTYISLFLGDEKQTLSKNMSISYEVYVPKSLMAKSGMRLILTPRLSFNDENWNWKYDVTSEYESLNIDKVGAGYKYCFYCPKKKKEIYKKKYVTITIVGKYMKVSVKKLPLLSHIKTDDGRTISLKGKKGKIEFGMSLVGTKKAKTMCYFDNVKINDGKKVIAKDALNDQLHLRTVSQNGVKQALIFPSPFKKNKIPSFKKVPDDIRIASSKQFVKRTSKKAITCTISAKTKNKAEAMREANYQSLPDWHGVNLCTMYGYGVSNETYNVPYFTKELVDEISKQGFDFLRVTLDTRIVYSQVMTNGYGPYFKGNDSNVNLNVLKNIDDLIAWCVDKNIHVCLDCHNTPGGYMLGGDEEASRELLFTDGSKEQQYYYNFWDLMAKRYKGISSNAVSFNLYNEPPAFATDEQYSAMMKKAIHSIHKIDEDRLLFVDMLDYAKKPVMGLVGEKIVQASHIYTPSEFTGANYEKAERILRGITQFDNISYDYDAFHAAILERMEEIREFREKTGTMVMIQEFGCTNHNSIKDIVAYYDDILSLAKEYSLPWAMWDYDGGTFGYVNKQEFLRIPGAHYEKIGDHRYVAKEVKDVLQKYMNN